MDDANLLRAFVKHRDKEAFAQLVRRYVDLVYATARRRVRDAHLVSQRRFSARAVRWACDRPTDG